MTAHARTEPGPTLFLEALRDLPFIRKVSFGPTARAARADGILTLHADSKPFVFEVVQNRSYLDRASLHALTALAAASKRPLIVFARYIPRPSGERLAAAGVNFIDQAGNHHILLGRKYAHTVLGRPQTLGPAPRQRLSAAQVQMLFAYAADPTILTRPVREIARQAGIGKSKAAEIRQQLMKERERQATGASSMQQRLLSGYADVLRPKLFLGRFRAPEPTTDAFLDRLRQTAEGLGVRFSLTGAPAAERLQHFYRGPEAALFIEPWNPDIRQRLRLLPDREGSLTLLRAFGELAFWRPVEGLAIAHPWLVYAELMYSDDPRAHESATELHREYLSR